ncbi:MAG: hypothetical protein HY042_12230, partial [Spirochaetia bacterium]|nr:hypothetical protein [Spirochaetia bacterium]
MPSLTGEQRAALVLNNLPAAVAEKVLRLLGPINASRLRAHINRLRTDPEDPEISAQVYRDFQMRARKDRLSRPSSPTEPGALHAYRENAATGPSDELAKPALQSTAAIMSPPPLTASQPRGSADPLAQIRDMPLELLAGALREEHPRAIALVLECLEVSRAGEILKLFPPEVRRPASLHLGQMSTVSVEVQRLIAQAVIKKAQAQEGQRPPLTAEGKCRKMAEILRLLDKSDRTDLLNLLSQQDAELAAKVKECLYQFEDLLLIEDRSLQKLLSEIVSRDLATALKGATEAIKEKVLANLSKRAR